MATAGAEKPAGVTLDEYTFSRGQESTANLQTKLANTLRGHECYPSECILYHYTGLEAARSICAGGFRRSPVGMAGPGIYFSTISPADALGGEGGPRWPDPAFTEQMLRNNFGDAAAEAGRLGKLDVVLVCKLSRDTIKDVPDRPEAKYVGDAILRTEHRVRYSSEFPQPTATYLRQAIVAGYVLKRVAHTPPVKAAPTARPRAKPTPLGEDSGQRQVARPGVSARRKSVPLSRRPASASGASGAAPITASPVAPPPVTTLAETSPGSLHLATGSLPASGKRALVESDANSDASPREVITMCLEGDFSAFDEGQERRLKKAFAGMLDAEVSAKQIRIHRREVTSRVAVRIGTGRCRVRVEVDGDGWAKYSDDSATAGSSTDDDATSTGSGSTLDSIDSSLTELIGTKY